MDFGSALKSAARSVKDAVVQETKTYLIPVKLQQLYKGYKLRDTTLGRIGMPIDFLVTLAKLSDHIYLTGTKAASHRPGGQPVRDQPPRPAGEMFQNYMQLDRFDAATGLAFETRGPFGTVIASAVPPGLEAVPVKGSVHPDQARYRLFIVFRGTVPAIGDLYTDDLSTDAKTAAPKLVNSLGNRLGEVARGFFNTYVSCRSRVVERLLPRGLAFLNARYREFAGATGGKAASSAARRYAPRLPAHRVELYVVGHSLGGAVATLSRLRPGLPVPAL